ncbi:MAG TPA: hypothetical protein VKY19_27225 [Ktedonosporobacter sp.]|nr:hypothetical protein [Ktedonosporobacter sp.]
MADWYTACKANADKDGVRLCQETHCASTGQEDYNHKFCECKLPSQPYCKPPTPGCCPFGIGTVIATYDSKGFCYCCCQCFAFDTPVAVSADTFKAIQDFQIGDLVYVADLKDSQFSWRQAPVEFSSGTGALSQASTFVQVAYRLPDEAIGTLLATPSQIFMVAGNKLKRADTLVPGDLLTLAATGEGAPVVDLQLGSYEKGIHHIATTVTPAVSVNGHLLNVQGVICGDFALQLALEDASVRAKLAVANPDQLPVIGTKEYIEQYKDLATGTYFARAGDPAISSETEGFHPYQEQAFVIPDAAQSFLTEAQATDIARRAPRQPPYSGAGQDIVKYLFKLYGAFYPQVRFVLMAESEACNAYAQRIYDTPFVVISGGLVRVDALRFEGLAFILAHLIGVLFGGEPLGENDLTCRGAADYAAIVSVIGTTWRGTQLPRIIEPLMQQITELYSYISEANRQGRPGNTCSLISIDCRLEAMRAAMRTQPLPVCAGGPKISYLELKHAVASLDADKPMITLTFNMPLKKLYAEYTANYTLSSGVEVETAKLSSTDPEQVVLHTSTLQPGIEYTLVVAGLLSETNDGFKDGSVTAKVKLAS